MESKNFLNYDDNLKTAYVVALASIASADHQSTPEEVAFLEQMGIAAHLSDASKAIVKQAAENLSSINLNDYLTVLKDSDLKFAMVADVINLVYVDGKLDETETAAIHQINGVLGVSDDQYKALQQYVTTANKQVETTGGNAEVDSQGQPIAQNNNFLETSGLTSVFQQMGIPLDHFMTGSTIGAKLTSTAFYLLKSYINTNTNGAQGNSLGQTIGAFIGNVFGSTTTTTQTNSQTTSTQTGITDMISGFFKSEAGSNMINGVLNNVVNQVSQGKGIGNLSSILNGISNTGTQNPINLNNILASLMKK